MYLILFLSNHKSSKRVSLNVIVLLKQCISSSFLCVISVVFYVLAYPIFNFKKDDFTKRMSEKKLKKLKDEITSYCVITSSDLVR